MEESASGGRMSTSALEWRCSAIDALGFSSSLNSSNEKGYTGSVRAPQLMRADSVMEFSGMAKCKGEAPAASHRK